MIPNKPVPPDGGNGAAQPTEESQEVFRPSSLLKPKERNHVWHCDLTCVQFLWFRWTVFGLMDGFSRKLLALKLFVGAPTTDAVIRIVDRAVRREGTPRFLITDHGAQFRRTFEFAMEDRDIKVVRGRVGNFRMNGKIERLFRTLKLWQRLILLPINPRAVQRKLESYRIWYNRHRSHMALGIQTPEEVNAGCDPPKPIPIRAGDDIDPIIRVRRVNFDGNLRMPVIDINVKLKRRRAA